MPTNGKQELAVRRSPLQALDELLPPFFSTRWPFESRFPFGRALRLAPDLAPIDMFEKDGKVVVKAEMPGIEPGKIDVTVVGGELRISGERSEEKELKEEDYYFNERSSGRIYRTVTLPEGCDADNVSASMKEGVLEVVIARKQAAATKKIEVKTG